MNWEFCPLCGHRIYQHSGPDHFTGKWQGGCTHVETTGHVVKFNRDATFTLKHPMAERESDKLFECTVHQRISQIGLTEVFTLGEFAVVETDDGTLSFVDSDKARTMCDCAVPYRDLAEHRV
jgi:hypothetical protein